MDSGTTVWLYWEGPCPEWIERCQASICRHAGIVRLVTPAIWNDLWTEDRDIDLTALGVEHRADFIRLYLLAHYGGLWIDSDCVVLRSLEPLFAVLPTVGAVGYQEHYGHLPTAFLGGPYGSIFLAACYDRMCALLRSQAPRRWTWPADIVARVNYQLPNALILFDRDLIQPVAWDHQGEFYAVRSDPAHAEHLQPGALCSMLAYTACKQYEFTHPGEYLLKDGTYFRYLLRQSGEAY